MDLKEKYTEEIRKWEWDKIKAECRENVHENEDGEKEGSCYIGSVMSLHPSGKYYNPIANSNLEPCEKCSGKGDIENPKSDPQRHKLLEDRIQELLKPLLAKYGAHNFWPEEEKKKVEKARAGKEECQPWLTCETCGGLGSEEAFKDQEWQEALEEVCGENDCWSHCGEGDPTDMFIGMSIEEEAPV